MIALREMIDEKNEYNSRTPRLLLRECCICFSLYMKKNDILSDAVNSHLAKSQVPASRNAEEWRDPKG